MKNVESSSQQPEMAEGRRPKAETKWHSPFFICHSSLALLGAVCVLVLGIYGWRNKSAGLEVLTRGAENAYYNLVVDSFRAGQMNLQRQVPPELARVAVPFDPTGSASERYPLHDMSWVRRHGLHDLSYYRGRLYLYFSVVPALVLFWPWHELGGGYLRHEGAVVIFFSVGFLASVGLWWAMGRRCFDGIGAGVLTAGAVALGLANFIPAILAGSQVYEVAISCGYACTMLTLGFVWEALSKLGTANSEFGRGNSALRIPRSALAWLAAASMAYGLAVGARPTWLFGAVILLIPVWQSIECRVPGDKSSRASSVPFLSRVTCHLSLPLLLAALVPVAVIGLGLMLYNYARFDDPLEFGQRYQLPVSLHDQFSLAFFGFNFRVALLEPARWSFGFPFVQDIALPPFPKGYFMVDFPFGVLANLPVVWLALAAPLVWRNPLGAARSVLRGFVLGVSLLAGMCTLTLVLHDSMCLRYEVEFAALLVLMAVIGFWGLERALHQMQNSELRMRNPGASIQHPASSKLLHSSFIVLTSLLLVFSLGFNLLAGVARQVETGIRIGNALVEMGRTAEAINRFQKVLAIQPANAKAHTLLGTALFQLNEVQAAVGHLEQAVRLDPDYAEACNELGTVLAQQGRRSEAMTNYHRALQLKPDYGEAHCNLGCTLAEVGKFAEAELHFREAIRLKPEYAKFHVNFGNLLRLQGRWDEAIRCYEAAIQWDPRYAEAHYYLGCTLALQTKNAQAAGPLAAALELAPNFAAAANDLAWILATETNSAIRDVEKAVRLAERACELTAGSVPIYLDTLGVAYSEAGRFAEAIQATERAVARALAAGNTNLATPLQSRLEHFRAGRAWTEGRRQNVE